MAYMNPLKNLPLVGNTITAVSVTRTPVSTFPSGELKYTGYVSFTFASGYKCIAHLDMKHVEVDIHAFIDSIMDNLVMEIQDKEYKKHIQE